jgi:hypothetical protein
MVIKDVPSIYTTDVEPQSTDAETAEAQRAADRLVGQRAPEGHPFFYKQLTEEATLHAAKNHDYTAGGYSLGNFQRVAGILARYPGLDLADPAVVALVYVLKQLDAVLWGLAHPTLVHKVEGLHPRLTDISVYAKLVRCLLKDGGR